MSLYSGGHPGVSRPGFQRHRKKLGDRLRIVVSGLIGSIPVGGLTLHYLQYILGLRQLGHEVLYLEDVGGWYFDPMADRYYDPQAVAAEGVGSLSVAYVARTMESYGLRESWTFVDHAGTAFGVTGLDLKEFLATADLFVDVTGAGIPRDDYMRIPRRAYIDTDPGYIQLKIAAGSERELAALKLYTDHFSFGCNIGAADCLVPTLGLDWHPTVQPVCMDLWPMVPVPRADAPFTTILKWRTYQAVEHDGEIFGLKDVEFMKFLDLPRLTKQPLELATAGHPPVDGLEAIGWSCRSAPEISSSIVSYRQYIQGSRGEWSIAKNCYVKTRGGWFSDRSATYLASGRPAVLQATGFERWLPTGRGVIEFSTIEAAREAIESINGDYQEHSRAAREIAESFFEAHKVLGNLIDVSMSA